MIEKFVRIWDEHKEEVEEVYRANHPNDYFSIVENIITLLNKYDEDYNKRSTKVHAINDGDYQGTLLFLIPTDTYQPDEYYYVKIYYGSCSGCDTLEGIRSYEYDKDPSEEQVKDYMMLSLHIIQCLKMI